MLRMFSIIILALFSSSVFAAPAPMTEQQKIDALLNAFDTPDITFIRNGEEHDGAWAKQHLTEKMQKASPKVTTASAFISDVASTSSESGKPYIIKMKDGMTMASGQWLQQKLAGMTIAPSAGGADTVKSKGLD